MGHTRLGEIPKTRKWEVVVGAFGEASAKDITEGVPDIARETLLAAEAGLIAAVQDEGLRFAIREGGRTVGAGVVANIIE